MTENENNSSSNNIKTIFAPLNQQEISKADSPAEPIDEIEEILIEDKTKFKKDGL